MEILQVNLLDRLPIFVHYLLLAYLGFKLLDFVTGLLKTIKNKNYKSSKMRDGLLRWTAELVGIVFVVILDLLLGLEFMLAKLTLMLYIYKESGSILENLGEFGVKLPAIVKDRLETLNTENKKDGEINVTNSKETN